MTRDPAMIGPSRTDSGSSRLGIHGVFGFVAVFGLLLTPIVLAQRQLRRSRSLQGAGLVGILALIVAISAVDLIPNAMLTSFTVFLSGALAGVVPGSLRVQREAAAAGDLRR